MTESVGIQVLCIVAGGFILAVGAVVSSLLKSG